MAGIQPGEHPLPGPQQSIHPPPPGPGTPTPAPAPSLSPGWREQRRSRYPRRIRRLLAFAIIILPTSGLLIALLIVGHAAPSSSAQSAPFVNVTVRLLGATCRDRGVDLSCNHNFYVLGALVAPAPNAPAAAPNSQAQVTPPMQIGSSGAMFPEANQPLFTGMVSPDASLLGGLIAYDDRKGLTKAMLSVWSGAVAGDVAAQLKQMGINSGNLSSRSSSTQILGLAAQAWFETAGLTSSNTMILGQSQPLMIPATGMMSEQGSRSFMRPPDGPFDEGFDYILHYQITRTPMAAALARQPHTPAMSEQEALTRGTPAVTIGAIAGDVAHIWRSITYPKNSWRMLDHLLSSPSLTPS